MAKPNKIKKIILKILSFFLKNKRYERGINPDKVKKILVIRNDALGDMLITMPALALLKQIAPKAELHVLASNKNYRLLENDNNIDRIFIDETSTIKKLKQAVDLRKESYDVIISTIYVGITKQGLLANIIGGRQCFKSLLYSGKDKYTYFNFQSKIAEMQTPMWEKMYAQFADTFDYPIDFNNIIPYLETGDKDKFALKQISETYSLKHKDYIVVNLSAGQERNQISQSDYVEILDIINRVFHKKIVLIHMPNEKNIAEGLSNDNVIALSNLDILTVAELIRNAILCVSPDTGIVHLASAVRTATIAIFNSEYHSRFWAPYKVAGGKIVRDKDMLFQIEELAKKTKQHLDKHYE
jgi:ADP-heptose:LPS heptosyltransferase